MAPSEHDEQVDPGRSLRLLWRLEPSGRRGPKPRLDLDDIVAAAIELADEDGLDELSIRRLADRLGVGAMTLYGYVHAKSDLLDLMHDRIVGERGHVRLRALPGDAPWRRRLEAVARDRWDLHRDHEWFSRMPVSRPPLGPNVMDAYEEAMSVFDGLALSGRERTDILSVVSAYVDGVARLAAEARTLPRETSLDERGWWEVVGPTFAEVFDAERFPRLADESMADAWQDPDTDGQDASQATRPLEFGLARMLDGIESWVLERT